MRTKVHRAATGRPTDNSLRLWAPGSLATLDKDVGWRNQSKEEQIFESSIFYSRKLGVHAQKKNELGGCDEAERVETVGRGGWSGEDGGGWHYGVKEEGLCGRGRDCEGMGVGGAIGRAFMLLF
jgi:hypothetical protein